MNAGDDQSLPYPPDRVLALPRGLSFTRLLAATVLALALLDFARLGNPETQVPYNYPFYFGILYLLLAVLILKRMYGHFETVRIELVEIAERTDSHEQVFDRPGDVDATRIDEEVECISKLAFHPAVLLGGAAVGGVFTVGVMAALDVFGAYPYLLLDFAYGAGHGLFYGPLLAAVYLVYQLSNRYIIDIDLLDPDGVGGYRQVGDAIVSLITYAIFLVTADFVILSSVSFVAEPIFQTAVFALYGAMLGFFVLLTVGGVMLIRRRLLDIRQRKTDAMRERFDDVEARFWEKHRKGVSPQPEADTLQTMQTLFDQLHGMNLWPLNLLSFARLGVSTAGSLVVAGWEAGLFEIPFL